MVLLPFGIPGDDSHGTQDGMDPTDELQPPKACIEADDPRAEVIAVNRPLQERPSERSIVEHFRERAGTREVSRSQDRAEYGRDSPATMDADGELGHGQ
jgi:hypothetical protein